MASGELAKNTATVISGEHTVVEVVVDEAEKYSGRHRPLSPHFTLWGELSDVKDALRRARSGNGAITHTLTTIRREGRQARRLGGQDVQLTLAQLMGLKQQYAKQAVARFEPAERTKWANNAGMALFPVDGQRPNNSLQRVYGMEAVSSLVRLGLLDDRTERGFEQLTEALQKYDSLRATKTELEQRLAKANFRTRIFYLGLSAIKNTVGLPIRLLRAPLIWLYINAKYRGQFVRAEEVRRGKVVATNLLLGAVGLGLVGAVGYSLYKSGNHDVATAVAGNDFLPTPDPNATAPAQPPATGPEVGGTSQPPVPPQGGTEVGLQFDPSVYQTVQGEGWIQQFSEMGLTYDRGFMDGGTGEWLERMGYAYREVNPQTGATEWGMNYVNISPRVLAELHERAKQAGLAA